MKTRCCTVCRLQCASCKATNPQPAGFLRRSRRLLRLNGSVSSRRVGPGRFELNEGCSCGGRASFFFRVPTQKRKEEKTWPREMMRISNQPSTAPQATARAALANVGWWCVARPLFRSSEIFRWRRCQLECKCHELPKPGISRRVGVPPTRVCAAPATSHQPQVDQISRIRSQICQSTRPWIVGKRVRTCMSRQLAWASWGRAAAAALEQVSFRRSDRVWRSFSATGI